MMFKDDPAIQVIEQVLDEALYLIWANLPTINRVTMQAVELVFAPTTIARQLVVAIALQTGAVTLKQMVGLVHFVASNFSSQARLIRQLQSHQDICETQDEWMDLAERIDNIQGNDVWRSTPECALYERERIAARIDEFVHLMRRRDIFDLMFTLRGGIGRNKFGLLHEGLFTKAMAGSKVLVETYHNVVCAALDFCADAPVLPSDDPIPTEARLAFFNETRHSYGRTALLLSGGAALGFYHVGVVKALMENGLMPRVLGGSSAGSIVCAMVGTRTDEECINDLFQVKGTTAPGHSGKLRFKFFRPLDNGKTKSGGGEIGEVLQNSAGAFVDAKRTWQVLIPVGLRSFTSVVYDLLTGNRRSKDLLMHDTDYFREVLRDNVGNFTFQEAFDRTGRILNITVTPKNSSDPPRLLNYLTAPHVLVWSAAVASSSLPGVFEANKLMVKDADGTERFESASSVSFSDGSMEADLPMQQLSEMFNVNHFIISQANPHAVMFASFSVSTSIWSNPLVGMMNGVLLFLKNQLRSWFSHLVELVGGRRIAPLFDTSRGVGSTFFTQEYEGRDCDISLIPWIRHRGLFSALLHCIYNPSEDDFREWVKVAEREVWRYIPTIKSHIAEEVTLDRCVQRLRKQVITESREKKRPQDAAGETMGRGHPSFFTSPSLVNLGGLGIGDQVLIDSEVQRESEAEDVDGAKAEDHYGSTSPEINPGWSGMGLRGNHSQASLARSNSGGSGLFFMDSEEEHEVRNDSGTTQIPGELTVPTTKRSGSSGDVGENYFKTTSMAHFYYRNAGSQEDLLFPKSKSHGHLSKSPDNASPVNANTDEEIRHSRQKSKSNTELGSVFPPPSTTAEK